MLVFLPILFFLCSLFFSRRNHRRFTIFVRKKRDHPHMPAGSDGRGAKEETIWITTTWDGMI